MGVLNWISNFFTTAGRTIDTTVANVVGWALRAVTSVIFGQFQATQQAWVTYYNETNYYVTSLRQLSTATRSKHSYTLKVRIPGVISWAAGNFGKLLTGLSGLAAAVARDVSSLSARITAGLADLTKWVITEVYDPLKALIDQVDADLLKWGYTAWWWITNLDKLADALILYLAKSAETYAWELAGMLGQFTVNLIYRNAARIASLLESIVLAVF
jgi:hypothetical protein